MEQQNSIRPPLVATLAIDASAQTYFNALRKKHFPPERNFIDAHLTLFNALPHEEWVLEYIKTAAENQPRFEITVQQIMSLGGGTAFKISSPELVSFHQKLQKHFFGSLTNQDKQKRNFHITIQNKVSPAEAKALQAELIPDFKSFSAAAEGLGVWKYLGGPWEFLERFGFGGLFSDANI